LQDWVAKQIDASPEIHLEIDSFSFAIQQFPGGLPVCLSEPGRAIIYQALQTAHESAAIP